MSRPQLCYAERFMLLNAMITRRVPRQTRIRPDLLLKALEADLELVRQNVPHLYFTDWWTSMQDNVDVCVELELIEDGWASRMGKRIRLPEYRRTKTGQQYLDTLEPHLAELLDSMPMSGVGVLDFLSHL